MLLRWWIETRRPKRINVLNYRISFAVVFLTLTSFSHLSKEYPYWTMFQNSFIGRITLEDWILQSFVWTKVNNKSYDLWMHSSGNSMRQILVRQVWRNEGMTLTPMMAYVKYIRTKETNDLKFSLLNYVYNFSHKRFSQLKGSVMLYWYTSSPNLGVQGSNVGWLAWTHTWQENKIKLMFFARSFQVNKKANTHTRCLRQKNKQNGDEE